MSSSKVLGSGQCWDGRAGFDTQSSFAGHQNSNGKAQHLHQRGQGRELLRLLGLMAALSENLAGTLFGEEGIGFMASTV